MKVHIIGGASIGVSVADHLSEYCNVKVYEKDISYEDLLNADEAFFTGTAVEVIPINAIDNKSIADGLRGPITEKLQKAYLDQVRGKGSGNKDWQTPVGS